MLAAGSPPLEKQSAAISGGLGAAARADGKPEKNTKVCKCGNCADCTQRAAVKKTEAMERKSRYRAAKIAADDHSDQAKNTKARQKKRAANKAAGNERGKERRRERRTKHQGLWKNDATCE